MDTSAIPRTEGKVGAIGLIRHFFGQVSVAECRAITDTDKRQLGTAIAQQVGIPAEECNFEFAPY